MRFQFLGLAVWLGCLAVSQADDRLPLPDETAQKEADSLVKEVFGQAIKNARTPDQQATLVKKLLEEAARADMSAAGRYATLKTALDVAPDANVAMSVIDTMAKHFQIDEMRAKAYTVKQMSEGTVLPHARKPLAEAAVQLADAYIAQDNFPAAAALIDMALDAAIRSRDSQLVRDIRAKRDDVRSLQKSYAEVQQAVATLETDPADAKSNLIVGRYKCFVKGDSEDGLPMLALGDDPALQKLAVKELMGPKASGEQVELADGWFDMAQQADGSTKQRMLQRAGFWYRLSLNSDPALSRLAKIKVEQRLEKLGPELEKLAPNNGSSSPPLAVAPFNDATAKKHQRAWSKFLGQPVEKDFVLPGGVKLTMVLIPPGEFVMGSTAEEQARFLAEARAANDTWAIARIPSEGPQHRVRITRPFYLGKYEVAQAQWQAVMGNNPSRFQDNRANPVEQVSWNEMQPFLAKLNESHPAEKMRFVLPTEAQWEYACRAGTTTAFWFGDNEAGLVQFGWFNATSGGKSHPVGQLKPNAFGLHDMHGNVWEWCADWDAADYYAKAPVDDPTGPSAGSHRVIRGGSWNRHPGHCRSAYRDHFSPDGRGHNLGFRLASVPADE